METKKFLRVSLSVQAFVRKIRQIQKNAPFHTPVLSYRVFVENASKNGADTESENSLLFPFRQMIFRRPIQQRADIFFIFFQIGYPVNGRSRKTYAPELQ